LYQPSDWSRLVEIPSSPIFPLEKYRSDARRDSARLTHSPAFRRLQGKTQLFPGAESDYFRNRLTHSLEVAQIAKSIAIRLNSTQSSLRANPLDLDLVEFAGWCHDLGHPPFGHQGEEVLDEIMRDSGGFEGNAQTLRIIARLEKREKAVDDDSGIAANGKDQRLGLNLCARSVAAVLKYDNRISSRSTNRKKVAKGYYESEANVVRWLKRQVAPKYRGHFKTVDCQIMDVADDIAYSTYDLEDTFKAGFLNPLDLVASVELYEAVARKVSLAMSVPFTPSDVRDTFLDLFRELSAGAERMDRSEPGALMAIATVVYTASRNLGRNGYGRSDFTSGLIRAAIEGVTFNWNPDMPAMSKVQLTGAARRQVEVLKHFTYEATIQSSRVSVSQYRARDILRTIFSALEEDQKLLADDVRRLYHRSEKGKRRRVICDFIAGMTDRYAIEFFGRIKSENPETIFKPL
jgi:dGTPase